MKKRSKRLTNMVWRSMGESMLLAIFFLLMITYFLYYYGYIQPVQDWFAVVMHSLTLFIICIVVGALFGFLYSYRMKNRLVQLQDAMLLLEKGNLSKSLPDLGVDEIGQLAVRLNRISEKWEEQVSSLQRLSTDNAELAERAKLTAVIDERQRLARELHDAVSQQLFAISMTATAVGRTLEKDFEKAKRQISLIEEMSSVAQSEMRALLLHLRPVHLEGKGLTEGILGLVQELKAKVPLEITVELDEDIQLAKGIEDHLFRIVQEALSNVLRHSKADQMEIKLQRSHELVRLTIRDHGIGFDPEVKKNASYGLASMRERVNEIGGSIHIITAPEKGTRIDIRVPLVKDEGVEKNEKSN